MELIVKTENGAILNPKTSQQLAQFEKQIAALKKAHDNMKAQILAEMEAQNIIKIDTEDLTITYVAGTYRETFDSKALKEADETTYNKYIKISNVNPSIRIKVK